MTNDKAMMERIRDLLPTELFAGSKDWREGNTIERIEWLLSMYESSKQEVERLEESIENLTDEMALERRYFGVEE